MLDFTRPNCLDDDEWQALAALHDRLERALRDDDPELMLGTAKELCEAVAKVTHQQRNEQFATKADMSELINGAHKLIDRLPEEGGAQGGAVRNLAQGAKKVANQLNELRNQAGSGHGRPSPTGLDEIDGRFAAGAALLWCSWVLARLDAFVANDPDRLAADIAGDVFYAGDITRRLTEAGLPTMDERDQRIIGFAVGQRGGPGGTVNVYREGVLPARLSPDLVAWPAEYRRGVGEGLVTDRNGYIVASPAALGVILELASPLPDKGASVIAAIREKLVGSQLAYAVTDESRTLTVEALRDAAASMTGTPLAGELGTLADALTVDE